jgi:hypothetical protein
VFPQQIVVAAKIDALHAEAAAERLARSTKPASQNRIASALKSVWSTVNGPAERPALPRLADYPYRSWT